MRAALRALMEGCEGEAGAGCGVRCDGEGGEAGGSGDDYLYVGNDGRAEGRDADAWEPGEQLELLDGAVWDLAEKDSCISFLPLSHVTARHLDYAMMCHGATLAYCPKFDQLAAAMKAVKPTIFVAVPRVYEKIRQAVEGKSALSPVKLKILRWALGVGKKHRAETLAGKDAGRGELEAGEQAGVLEDSGGVWRAGERCLSRAARRWGWIRRDGLRMWGFGSSRGMG